MIIFIVNGGLDMERDAGREREQDEQFDLGTLVLPGMKVSRQKRSRETTAALLRTGAEMLRHRSLDELSIEALCAAVGATVGAFYSRFDSKEVYFSALLELAARDAAAGLARLSADRELRRAKLPALCEALVRQIAGWMRLHEGVVRAALQQGDPQMKRWSRFKQFGQHTVAAATPALLRLMGPGRRAAKERAIGFAFQTMFGTLVNAVLNDPGPVALGTDEINERLTRLLLIQLQLECDPTASG
jgi:AcrR family transcriptional regulator